MLVKRILLVELDYLKAWYEAPKIVDASLIVIFVKFDVYGSSVGHYKRASYSKSLIKDMTGA